MAALSDYMESGLLHYVFRGQSFPQPANISIALTSGVPLDSDTGATIPELPTGVDGTSSNYNRVSLGDPTATEGDSTVGAGKWLYKQDNHTAGSGMISNSGQIVFNTALTDWGWVSGIAIVDNSTVGQGNVLMHAQLTNPRLIYTGDNVKFDVDTLEISFK